MHTENIVFRIPDSGPFISASYYSSTEHPEHAAGGFTLVFAHCSGVYNEQRDDTIAKLLRPSSQLWRIRDAWALDAQNYGEDSMLHKNPAAEREPLSMSEFAKVLRYFVTSKMVQGRNIIAIGVSESLSAWTMACAGATLPVIRAMIFFQPVIEAPPVAREDEDPTTQDGINVVGVLTKSDAGNRLATPRKALPRWYDWKLWDERVFESCLKYGFVEYHNNATGLVEVPETLPSVQEVGFYITKGRIHAGALTSDVCQRYPVNIVFGKGRETVLSDSCKSTIVGSKGLSVASPSIVPSGLGQLSAQEHSEGITDAIMCILQSLPGINVKAARTAARL